MLTRHRSTERLAGIAGIPILEASDLPVDDDWTVLQSIRHDRLDADDGDFDLNLSPDFD